jgi:hypothetical protein
MFLAGQKHLATTGLNVTSPLVQGVVLSGIEKEAYRLQLLASVDPEIRTFPQARKQQLMEKNWRSFSDQPVEINYQDALAEACSSLGLTENLALPFDGSLPCSQEDVLDSSIDTALQEAAYRLEKLTGSTVLLSMPFGSFAARLGIILDHDLLRTDESDIPTALKEIGFHNENCLVWPFNLQNHYLASSSQMRHLGSETDILRSLNQKIIEVSNLRVIILCGDNAEACILSPELHPINIKLGKCPYRSFVQIKDSRIKRIYINASAAVSSLYSVNWNESLRFALALKFALQMTSTCKIRPFLYRSRRALLDIVIASFHENNGEEKMTPETMPPSVKAWLFTKGFTTDDDFKKLEDLGGTFTKGLLLAMCTAPACPENERPPSERPILSKNKFDSRLFTKKQLDEMRSIHKQKRSEIYSRYPRTAIVTDIMDVPETSSVSDDYEYETMQQNLLDRLSNQCLSDEGSVHSVIKDVLSVTVYETIASEVQSQLTKPPKRGRPKGLIPAHIKELRESENCWWCDAILDKSRCWNFDLQERLCHRCAMNALNSGRLQILKKQIMELEIRCGCCKSLFGSQWTFTSATNLPTCSLRCQSMLLHNDKSEYPDRSDALPNSGEVRYQDQCTDHLFMRPPMVAYFKDVHDIDTSIVSLVAQKESRSEIDCRINEEPL